jgi:hypothetical protein
VFNKNDHHRIQTTININNNHGGIARSEYLVLDLAHIVVSETWCTAQFISFFEIYMIDYLV